MKASALRIAGAAVITSPVFDDGRGFFREWFKSPDLIDSGIEFRTEQANLSRSVTNTIRGLHYSIAPEGQAKIVTCVAGRLDEVLCDVRVGSPTFGRVEYLELVAEEGTSVFLPSGVAHGFCVPEGPATMAYLLSSPYNPALELEISPFDAELAVPWRVTTDPVLSAKDAAAPSLAQRLAAGQLAPYISL